MTSQLQNTFVRACDFSLLDSRSTCAVNLCARYIAKGRAVSDTQLVVEVLDQSEMADLLRATPHVDFEIDTEHGMTMFGQVFVEVGPSIIGTFGMRYLEVVLSLGDASLRDASVQTLRWMT